MGCRPANTRVTVNGLELQVYAPPARPYDDEGVARGEYEICFESRQYRASDYGTPLDVRVYMGEHLVGCIIEPGPWRGAHWTLPASVEIAER